MHPHRIRDDLKRAAVGGYELPLGLAPLGLPEPTEGFTLRYEPGEDGEPDTYCFHIVVSHSRLPAVIDAAFELLPQEVVPIVEIGSRDAFRTTDIFLGRGRIGLDEFLNIWRQYEDVLLEDASIGAGAQSEEPALEVFLDSWKGLLLQVPIGMRREVERMLERHGLSEVLETWPDSLEDATEPLSEVREVLQVTDEDCPDLDEILLQLREGWDLELDVDPEDNIDGHGRRLGLVLWHTIAMARPEGPGSSGAYLTYWLTAGSIAEVERMVQRHLEESHEWRFDGLYSVDRVAFDERPDSLADLPARRDTPAIHAVDVDSW